MNQKLIVIFLVIILVAVSIIPLMIVQGSEFGGADGAAEEVITSIQPTYEPWISPIWEPPGGETESLLFALQAALGAGIIGYYFGVKRGQNKKLD